MSTQRFTWIFTSDFYLFKVPRSKLAYVSTYVTLAYTTAHTTAKV